MEQLLTEDQVAEYLVVSPRTVRRLVDQGELTYIKVGKGRRIHPKDLERFVERQRSGGKASEPPQAAAAPRSRADDIVETLRHRRRADC